MLVGRRRQVGDGGDVADRVRVRPARHGEVGADRHPPGPAGRQPQRLGQRAGLHPGGPDQGVAGELVAVGEAHGRGVDLVDLGAQPHLDPSLLQRLERVVLRLRAEGFSSVSSISTRTMRARLTSKRLEVPRRTMWNSSLERAGHLHAGRTAADDDERQRALVDQRRVGVDGLEPLQHVVPQADGVGQVVEGEAVLVDALDAERVGGGAGGHDQVVEGEVVDLVVLPLDVEQRRSQSTPVTVAWRNTHVGLPAEDPAHRIGDVGGVQAGRGHLVQQRLEGVEVVPVDQRDVDRSVASAPRRRRARRTRHR